MKWAQKIKQVDEIYPPRHWITGLKKYPEEQFHNLMKSIQRFQNFIKS